MWVECDGTSCIDCGGSGDVDIDIESVGGLVARERAVRHIIESYDDGVLTKAESFGLVMDVYAKT